MICIALILLSPFLAGGDTDWKTKAFPEWNEQSVLRMVTDSPWAKGKRVKLVWQKQVDRPFRVEDVPGTSGPQRERMSGMSPVGGIGVPRKSLPESADILVRWASALPVRHAKALYQQLSEKQPASGASARMETPPKDYVLELFGIPAEIAHQGPGVVEAHAVKSGELRTTTGRVLKATSAEAKVTGLTMTLKVHFSNAEPLTVADEEVECRVDLQVFEVKERFKLAPMQYQGHLEL